MVNSPGKRYVEMAEGTHSIQIMEKNRLQLLLIANIVAIAIAIPTEMRHREFARFLTNAAEKYFGRHRLQG